MLGLRASPRAVSIGVAIFYIVNALLSLLGLLGTTLSAGLSPKLAIYWTSLVAVPLPAGVWVLALSRRMRWGLASGTAMRWPFLAIAVVTIAASLIWWVPRAGRIPSALIGDRQAQCVGIVFLATLGAMWLIHRRRPWNERLRSVVTLLLALVAVGFGAAFAETLGILRLASMALPALAAGLLWSRRRKLGLDEFPLVAPNDL